MNCCSKICFLILGIGRLVTTEYRVLPSIRYSAEPNNRTEFPRLYLKKDHRKKFGVPGNIIYKKALDITMS